MFINFIFDPKKWTYFNNVQSVVHKKKCTVSPNNWHNQQFSPQVPWWEMAQAGWRARDAAPGHLSENCSTINQNNNGRVFCKDSKLVFSKILLFIYGFLLDCLDMISTFFCLLVSWLLLFLCWFPTWVLVAPEALGLRGREVGPRQGALGAHRLFAGAEHSFWSGKKTRILTVDFVVQHAVFWKNGNATFLEKARGVAFWEMYVWWSWFWPKKPAVLTAGRSEQLILDPVSLISF